MKTHIHCILILLLFSVVHSSNAQQNEYPTTFFDEKVEVLVGIGAEYSLLGPLLQVKTFKNAYAMGSLFFTQKYGFAWNLGFQYRIPIHKRWCPFVQVFFGDNRYSRLYDNKANILTFRVFQSPGVGIGMKFRYPEHWKPYLNLCINYSWPIKLENEFYRDYNSKVGARYYPLSGFRPSLGLSLPLSYFFDL